MRLRLVGRREGLAIAEIPNELVSPVPQPWLSPAEAPLADLAEQPSTLAVIFRSRCVKLPVAESFSAPATQKQEGRVELLAQSLEGRTQARH